MTHLDNPAERLLTILLAAREAITKNSHGTADSLWQVILKVDPQRPGALFDALHELAELVREVQVRVESIPDLETDLYLSEFHKLYKVIDFNRLNANFSEVTRLIDDGVILNVKLCMSLLKQHHLVERVDENEIQDFGTKIDELIASVLRADDITSAFKLFLLKNLYKIRYAVSRYAVDGFVPMEQAIAQTAGESMAHAEHFADLKKTKTGNAFVRLMRRGLLMVTLATGAETLIAQTAKDIRELFFEDDQAQVNGEHASQQPKESAEAV